MEIKEILEERGKRYGEFEGHALITTVLKQSMHLHDKWHVLLPHQKEALDMIQHKIGRILNGDPNWIDSWDDIAGYAKLVADILRKKENKNEKV